MNQINSLDFNLQIAIEIEAFAKLIIELNKNGVPYKIVQDELNAQIQISDGF
jgi:hypothetical protein